MNTRRASRAADGKEDTDMNMGRLYKLIYKGSSGSGGKGAG